MEPKHDEPKDKKAPNSTSTETIGTIEERLTFRDVYLLTNGFETSLGNEIRIKEYHYGQPE